MTSSSKKGNYREGTDERPVRLDHVLVGNSVEGSSVDGVPTESCRETEILKVHPLSALLYLTTKEGDVIFHPAFGEEVVQDLCTRVLGRRYERILKLNQMDYLVEFEDTDNPTIFAVELGSVHKWLGIDLHVDVHIGTKDTLRKVSQECEKACMKL